MSGVYQRHQVPRVLAAELSTAADGDERDQEDDVRDVIGPAVRSHEQFHILLEGEESDHGEGHQELDGQDQEDLRTEHKN